VEWQHDGPDDMKKALPFAFSAGLVTGLIFFFWVVGVLGQRPQIPPQTPDVSYVDIMLQRKKHNPIDDFYLCHPEHRT
jgi:hypothetical protein